MSLILPSSWSPVEPEWEDQGPFRMGDRLHELELRGKHYTYGAASHGGDMGIGSLMHACSMIEECHSRVGESPTDPPDGLVEVNLSLSFYFTLFCCMQLKWYSLRSLLVDLNLISINLS
jgi:hypothetical protein